MLEVNELTPNLKRATEIAQICNISRSEVYRYIHRHKLPKIVQKKQKTAYYELNKIQAILCKKNKINNMPKEYKIIYKQLNKIKELPEGTQIEYITELYNFMRIINELQRSRIYAANCRVVAKK